MGSTKEALIYYIVLLFYSVFIKTFTKNYFQFKKYFSCKMEIFPTAPEIFLEIFPCLLYIKGGGGEYFINIYYLKYME